MPTFNQVLGGLVVIAALCIAAHEIWLHLHRLPGEHTFGTARLRRRLTGVFFILALVGLLTWAGTLENRDPVKLVLYVASLLFVLLLFALALADVRAMTTGVLREDLQDADVDAMKRVLADPKMREIVEKMHGKAMTDAEVAQLHRALEQQHPPSPER